MRLSTMIVTDRINQAELKAFKEVGIFASKEAERALLANYETTKILEEKTDGDWVTEADILSDQIIRESLLKSHPSILIISEEQAVDIPNTNEPIWLVDPLDGTHNFMLGMPIFGISLTLIICEMPVLSIINLPFKKHLYVGIKDQGVTLNGKGLPKSSLNTNNSLETVCLVLGYEIRRQNVVNSFLLQIRKETKRVLELWSPSYSWCLVVRQKVDSIVSIVPGKFDSLGGILMLQEVEGRVTSLESKSNSIGLPFPIIVGSRNQVIHEKILRIVRQFC